MSTTATRRVLLIGKSRLVLDETVTRLRGLGFAAEATNDFSDVTDRFQFAAIDLVVFGGQVPADLKAQLMKEIEAINPRVIFVNGLAGIPGLITDQVRGAFGSLEHPRNSATTDGRALTLTLPQPAASVTATAYWATPSASPDPESDSLVLVSDTPAVGDIRIQIPAAVPTGTVFLTVEVDGRVSAFKLEAGA